MCGRYYVPDEDSAADLREIIEQINRRANAGPVVKTGEIAPSDVAPVLANNRNLAATPFAMRWGYRLGNGKLLFNARSETADAKALFGTVCGIVGALCPRRTISSGKSAVRTG